MVRLQNRLGYTPKSEEKEKEEKLRCGSLVYLCVLSV
jgi:hypothetical protein